MLPNEFLKRLKAIYPTSMYKKIVKTFEIRRKTTFRINLIKSSQQEIQRQLIKQKFKVKQIDWYKDAFILLNKSLKEFAQTEIYKEGKIYVQNLSSMLPPLILNPQIEDKILDLAAAPGSKTTQIASILKNKGMIIAIEKIKPRFYKLLANLKLQGVKNTQAILYDGIKIWRRYPEFFDKVLLDAPCSSEARFYIHEQRSFGYWKIKKIKEASKKQKGLIMSGIKALKVGGILVYSTCTFAPEENEAVIDWLLRRLGDKIKIEVIDLPIKNTMHGILNWKEKKFNLQVRNSLRIIPTEIMEGFFIVKIKKLETTI